MNKYLLEVERFFVGKEQFIVEANSKQEAIQKIKLSCDYKQETLKCIKKLQCN